MKKSMLSVLLIVMFGIGPLLISNKLEAVEVKYSGFFRQRSYSRWDWDFDKDTLDSKHYYEGLATFTAGFPVTEDVEIGIQFSEFYMWGMTMTPTLRPYIVLTNVLNLPVDFRLGCIRMVVGRGYLIDILGLNTYCTTVKFPPFTLRAVVAKVTETMTTGRDEDLQFGLLTYRGDIGEVEAGFYRKEYRTEFMTTQAGDIRADIKYAGFRLQAEGVYEMGQHGDGVDLKAMGGYATATYTFAGDIAPIIGASYFYMTGDKDDTPDEYEGFDQLYNPVYLGINYGEIAGRLADHNMTNIRIINPMVGLKVGKTVSVVVDYFMNTRDQVADGVDDNYGSEIRGAFSYKYRPKITWTFMYSHFIPGEYFGPDLDPASEFRVELMYLL